MRVRVTDRLLVCQGQMGRLMVRMVMMMMQHLMEDHHQLCLVLMMA